MIGFTRMRSADILNPAQQRFREDGTTFGEDSAPTGDQIL
jgi:hypothetical protein